MATLAEARPTAAVAAASLSTAARLRDTLLRGLCRALLVLVYAAILAPMILVFVSSFSESLYLSFPPQGFSTVSYQRFWANPSLREALNVSFSVAVATMLVAMLLAAPAAYALDRFSFRGRRLVEMILMSPIMLPVLMLAIALLIFISTLQIPRSFMVLVAGHVLVSLPFALRVMLTALAGFDRSLEEAAASLGAGPLETLRRVTLPLLQPGILSAAVLAFVISFGQITMSLFLAGENLTTLPVEIFLITDFGYDVAITAVSVVVMLVALVVVTIIERATGLERVV
jgi:putative spermidine/putrescine transport system permease protein